ncbi:helix-turn-helix domain-containing protein [Nocardiopsis coralliicola]
MSDDAPSLRQRWLGERLGQLRHDVAMSLAQAATATERSTASLSRIENGLVALRPRDVRPILDAYRVTDTDLRETIIAVAGEIQTERRGWWVDHHDHVSPGYLDLLRLEGTATAIGVYATGVIHGLLQHPDYARAAVAATGDFPSEQALEDFLALRTQRQKILTREDDAVPLHAVLHESLLHQPLGGTKVFQRQLDHLLECANRSTITVQVLPMGAEHPALAGAFTLLSLARLDVVHVELMTSDVYVEDAAGVARYREAFSTLASLAHGPDDSAALIAETINPAP